MFSAKACDALKSIKARVCGSFFKPMPKDLHFCNLFGRRYAYCFGHWQRMDRMAGRTFKLCQHVPEQIFGDQSLFIAKLRLNEIVSP
jgi:hypothetical protein